MNVHHALISTLQYDANARLAENYDAPELDASMLKWLNSLPPTLRTSYRNCFNDGWSLYNPEKEFKRMNIPDDNWRITHANSSYELCDTYPGVLAVPADVSDTKLGLAALFRSRGRLPVLSWRHPQNFCSITRSSQPMVGMQKRQSAEDEALLISINQAAKGPTNQFETPQQPRKNFRGAIANPFVVFDARPKLNATANQAAGKGYEMSFAYKNCNILFMNIDNIHVMRKSLDALEDHCRTPVSEDPNWYSQVEGSGWLVHVNRVLVAAVRLVHCICKEQLSVLVHCSDGWDRTAQLTSLSMLMMDPFYRTYYGFQVLIEKEWLSFGHKFGDRLGWSEAGWNSQERSPVFLQFLDCVHQLLHQNPQIFEFNEDLLVFIVQQTHTAWFGNFLLNSEKDRKTLRLADRTVSLWSYVLMNFGSFGNPHYTPSSSAVWVPVTSIRKTVLWDKWFLKWHDVVWRNEWHRKNEDFSEMDGREGAADMTSNGQVATDCFECQSKFSLFLRRNPCYNCKNIFCENCLVVKSDIHGKSHLYCRNCYDVYEEQINADLSGISKNVLMSSGMTRRVLGSASKMTMDNRNSVRNYPPPSNSAGAEDQQVVVTRTDDLIMDALPPLTKKQWMQLDADDRNSYVQDEETEQFVDLRVHIQKNSRAQQAGDKKPSLLKSLSSKLMPNSSTPTKSTEQAWSSGTTSSNTGSNRPTTAPPLPPQSSGTPPGAGEAKRFIPFNNAMMTQSTRSNTDDQQDDPPPLAKKYTSHKNTNSNVSPSRARNTGGGGSGGVTAAPSPSRGPVKRQTSGVSENTSSSRSPPRRQSSNTRDRDPRDALLRGDREPPPPRTDQQISILAPEGEEQRLNRKASSGNRFDMYKKNSVDLSNPKSSKTLGRRASQEETDVRTCAEENSF